MANINIDGKDYDVDSLNPETKGKVNSLLFVQNELNRLQAQIAVYKTAESAFTSSLKNDLSED